MFRPQAGKPVGFLKIDYIDEVYMNKTAVSPIVIIAAATATSFYGLYGLARNVCAVSSVVFIAAFITACAGLLLLGCVVPFLHRRFAQKRLQDGKIPEGTQTLNKKPLLSIRPLALLVLCISIGVLTGSYAELSLREKQRPPRTLTPLSAVKAVTAELTGEPIPAGHDYYRIPVRILTCTVRGGGHFSAVGDVQLLAPRALITGTYAGGISKIGDPVPVESAAPLLHNTAHYTEAVQNPHACRFYARGLRLLAQGSFNKTGTLFYLRPVQPVFLGWVSPLSRLRALFRFAFMRMLYGWGKAGGLLLALLAADKAFLPSECITAFRNAGLAHILALSGMHLSLISAAALQGGKIFGHKKRAFRFSLAAVCVFVWFAGAAPSLNRALGMIFIAAAGNALGLKPPLFSVLCAMLTVHIAACSADAITLGFMLSYGACAGIIIFGDACVRLAAGKIPPVLAQSISASVGAQLFTAPIVTLAIGSVAPIGIAASCIAGPLVSIFLVTGLVSIPLALIFPPIGPFVAYGSNLLYGIIFSSADFFARFPLITPQSAIQRVLFSAAAFGTGIALTTAARFQVQKELKQLPKLTAVLISIVQKV